MDWLGPLRPLGLLEDDMALLEEARAAIKGALEVTPEPEDYNYTLQDIEESIRQLTGGANQQDN